MMLCWSLTRIKSRKSCGMLTFEDNGWARRGRQKQSYARDKLGKKRLLTLCDQMRIRGVRRSQKKRARRENEPNSKRKRRRRKKEKKNGSKAPEKATKTIGQKNVPPLAFWYSASLFNASSSDSKLSFTSVSTVELASSSSS